MANKVLIKVPFAITAIDLWSQLDVSQWQTKWDVIGCDWLLLPTLALKFCYSLFSDS